jgi:hypothetical protein
MIARNEAHVIVRCLDSARPLIDFLVVVDTGSTDNTPEVVRRYLEEKNLPGEVLHEPWRDFAHNRNVAVRRLRGHTEIDYAMMLDADQILVYDADFAPERFKKKLRHEIYELPLVNGSKAVMVPGLARNNLEIFFKSELHEYPVLPPGHDRHPTRGLRIVEMHDGGRSRNPNKYRDDAAVLERLLRQERDPFQIARHTYFLAESYRQCGENEKALRLYLERTKLGFSGDEIFLSYLYAGRIQIKVQRPGNEVLETFLAGDKICPWRAEALHGAVQLCRLQGLHHVGYKLARAGLQLTAPESGDNVENWIYEYGLLDEFAVLCYWTGRYQECLDAATRILREGKIPESEWPRVQQNADFAAAKLKELSAHGPKI